MFPAGLKPAIPVSETQTYALGRVATGTGIFTTVVMINTKPSSALI